MKLDAIKFAIAGGITAGILRIICSFVLLIMHEGMMPMGAHMMREGYSGMQWHMGFGSILFSLMGSVFIGAVICWLFATIYNKLVGKKKVI